MRQVDRKTALAQLHADLADRPDLLRACELTVNFLCKQPKQALRRISFGLLGKAAGLPSSIDAVPIAEYLSSARMHLLEKQYVLIVDEEEFEIPLDDVLEAKRHSVLYHPDRGEEVKDFPQHLYLFFTPSPEGEQVFGGKTE